MRIPRDITGSILIRSLSQYGYKVTKQTGSHVRLTTYLYGEHHITIPNHNPIKIGTLNAILKEISTYLKIDKHLLEQELFE